MRAFPRIGDVTSCIAGKRSVKRRGVDADQKRLSNGEVGREQAGEQTDPRA
jgi:hypothetical protein